jgi:hypothetical protein
VEVREVVELVKSVLTLDKLEVSLLNPGLASLREPPDDSEEAE